MATVLREEQSNWGRWGETDERGALNLLEPPVIKAAASLVQRGEVISLAMPLARNHPIAGDRLPVLHLMSLDGGDYAAGVHLKDGFQAADDYVVMATQGTTHVDALSHAWYGDKLYNGHDPNRIRSYGATRCGIEKAESIVGRGVFLDVAAHLGVDRVPDDLYIESDVLDACARAEGVEIRAADIVLIRTGWMTMYYEDPERYEANQPGIGMDAARWLLAHDIAAVGSDNTAVEAKIGGGFAEGASAPIVHKLFIRDNGIHMIELMDLERLSASGVHEFLFVAAPLRIVGGVASPLNPLAIV